MYFLGLFLQLSRREGFSRFLEDRDDEFGPNFFRFVHVIHPGMLFPCGPVVVRFALPSLLLLFLGIVTRVSDNI